MNSTKLAARLHFMARQLNGEAHRHHGEAREQLMRAAAQTRAAFAWAYSRDPEKRASAEAILDGAIDYLVDVMTARTERELTRGITP